MSHQQHDVVVDKRSSLPPEQRGTFVRKDMYQRSRLACSLFAAIMVTHDLRMVEYAEGSLTISDGVLIHDAVDLVKA